MGVASWSFVVRAVWVWAGRGACSRGRLGDCTVVHCRAGLVGRLVLGIGDTPALLLLPAFVWGWGFGGCPRVCGGGMLSGFWGSAPWLPDPCSAALFVGGGVWVWVGWL